jgi:hypothetical protein
VTISPSKRLKTFNGYKLDGKVLIKTSPAASERREIRHLGKAGFHVRGLATCFYWLEKGKTWDDVQEISDSEVIRAQD